jgi:hypothetical protein
MLGLYGGLMFPTVWTPPDSWIRSPEQPLSRRPAGTEPGIAAEHPERLMPDLPPSPTERELWEQVLDRG